ncbi:MAG: hypothetical protein AAF348_07465 [Bacteroidota bacterium]
MSSVVENSIEITKVKTELAKTKKISELTVIQRRQMLMDLNSDVLPPMKYDSELAAIGDTVYGSGVAAINGGGFFLGTATFVPITQNSHVNQDIQL